MSSVYLETSFFSECCTIDGADVIAACARLWLPELVTPDLMRLE